MRLIYILLSPTFGMHQYTASLANQMIQAGHQVHLITTARYPRDRYAPEVIVHTPVNTRNTGFSVDGLRFWAISSLQSLISNLQPDLVHFTGPHLWNPILLASLRRAGIPTVHTIHDLDPHAGAGYGRLLYAWNNLVYHLADHILVHGECYRERLLSKGMPGKRVTAMPLLHLFLNSAHLESLDRLAGDVSYEPWALFFGRQERYKGVNHLLAAAQAMNGLNGDGPRLVLAGPGSLETLWSGPLPPGVEVRNRLIGDDEAIDLFRRCGLVVLPYTSATQSALVAAACAFRKPVIVTRSGALPEYVQDGRTGWVVEPGNAASLAGCLSSALSDPAQLARMGQAGQVWYDEQRGLESARLLEMYQKTIAQSSIGHG